MATGDFIINQGATITFKASGGDVVFDPSVANNNGHVSAPADLTTLQDALGPGLYGWGAKVLRSAGTPVVGQAVDIYLGLSDKTNDFNISQTSADFSSTNGLKGAMWIGQVLMNSTATGDTWTAFGEVFIPAPQVQAIWFNGTGMTTATTCEFYLFPLPYNEV